MARTRAASCSNAIKTQTEQMHRILTTQMSIPEPLISELSHYSQMTIEYWKLLDMIIDGAGFIRRDGLSFRVILRGKETETGLQKLADGMMRSGLFRVSFRSWKGISQYALVREELI